MICLMMSSPLHSQTLLSDSIVVPTRAVKNALIVKQQHDTCHVVLTITQEKIVLLEDKSDKQNQLILNLNKIITNKDAVIVEKDKIITIKEEQIEVLKKQKRSKFWNGVGLGSSVGIAVAVILLAL